MTTTPRNPRPNVAEMRADELTGGNLSRAVAKVALQDWKVTYSEYAKQWRVENPSGEIIKTFPTHWLESSIWRQLEDLFYDCATKADQALQLTVNGFALRLHQGHECWFASYHYSTNGMTMEQLVVYGKSTIPAEAICRARLKLAEYLAPGNPSAAAAGEE